MKQKTELKQMRDNLKNLLQSTDVARIGHQPKNNLPTENHHPTLKSIDMNAYIARIFKMPYQMKVLVPFAGTGSELLGLAKAGYDMDGVVGIELNPDYITIAEARLAHWLPKFAQSATLHIQRKDLPTKQINVMAKNVQKQLFLI